MARSICTGVCLQEGTPCCCDAFCICPDCAGCGTKDKEKRVSESAAIQAAEADEYSNLAGQHGVAESSLNPSGFVTFDGERVPGRSQFGEFIEAGAQVTAVSTNTFGVFVRRQSKSA